MIFFEATVKYKLKKQYEREPVVDLNINKNDEDINCCYEALRNVTFFKLIKREKNGKKFR